MEGGISTISLLTMGLVSDRQSGSAHGLACLVAQGNVTGLVARVHVKV